LAATEKNGLVATLEEYIKGAYEAQRETILDQFAF